MKISGDGGAIVVGSTKQRLNVRSLTVAGLVVVDDFLSKMMWVSKFLNVLGCPLQQNLLLQDNTSAILMQKNRRTCLGKWNRAIDVRYFVIKELIDKGKICVEYCNTGKMIANFLTKPLQGEKFIRFRKMILGMEKRFFRLPWKFCFSFVQITPI